MVLLRILKDLLDHFLVQVDLHHNAVGVGKDLIPLLLQQLNQGAGVRPLGDGTGQVAAVVKHRQPHAHAVGHGEHIVGIHLVVAQLLQYRFPLGVIVHQADEPGPQLHIGNVLRYIPAHAAVDKLHPPGVAPGGDIVVLREALHIHKHRANDHNRHTAFSFFS